MISRLFSLEDVCTDVSYGYTASAVSMQVGPKFLRITDIQGGIVNWDEVPYCEIDEKNLIKNKLVPEDIVIARTGNSTGENYLYSSEIPAVFASYLIRFRIDSNIALPYYIWLNLRTKAWWDFVSGSKTGSAQAGANAKVLGKFTFNLPTMDNQKRISNTIKSFNDKIQLNQQINQTLEAMAQALFKSWFVDFEPVKAKLAAREAWLARHGSLPEADSLFAASYQEELTLAAMEAISGQTAEALEELAQRDPQRYAELKATAELFPAELVESELGMIPAGWEVIEACKIFDISIGKTPPREQKQWFLANRSIQSLPWISIKDMGKFGIFTKNSSEFLTIESVKKFNIKVVPEKTVILSFKLTVGRVAITSEEITTNEAIAHFSKKTNTTISSFYLYLFLKQFNFETLGSTSSIAKAVNSKIIKTIPILFPKCSVKILEIFDAKVSSIFNSILNFESQNENLSNIRDSLLPKLLSGELSVEGVELHDQSN